MRASVVTIRSSELAALPAEGWVLATKSDLPLPANLGNDGYPERHVLLVEPGRSLDTIPGIVQRVVDGNLVNWSPALIAVAWPNGQKYVLETEWTEIVNGKTVFHRTKKIEVPVGATILNDNIVPCVFAGDA